MRALETIPNDLFTAGPFPQTLDAASDEPKVAGDFRAVMDDRVNIEGSDIASLKVFRVILRMIASGPAPIPFVPGNTLSQVEQHGSSSIRGAHPLVSLDHFLGRNRVTPAQPGAQRLRIVRFVPVHPADYRGIIQVAQRRFVLLTNHAHSRFFKGGQLFLRRSIPKRDVSIETSPTKPLRIRGCLQPDG